MTFPAIALLLAASLIPSSQDPIFLSDSDCGAETLFGEFDGARIFVTCENEGAQRVMRLSVNNMAAPEDGPLREISIGFCGDAILGASAPPNWATEVDQKEDGYVTWSLPDALVDQLGIPSRARAGGFVVRLKPGWRKSQWMSIRWGLEAGGARAMTHDCWPRAA